MKNNIKIITILELIISIIPLIIYRIVKDSLLETVPIHFNNYGIADGFVNKGDIKVVILCSAAVITFILMRILNVIILELFKKVNKDNINISNLIIHAVTLIIVTGMTLILSYYLFSVSGKFDFEVKNELLIINVTLGIIFITIGNYMPKFVINKNSGLRSKYALDSSDKWFQLQRIGAKVWIIGGLINIILSLVLINSSMIILLSINPIIATLIVIIPISYISHMKAA